MHPAATIALATLGALTLMPPAIAAGFGWLYLFRGLGWFAAGPRVSDALPLLQLAGFAAQPLLRVVIAWVLAGACAGILLAGLPRFVRAGTAALCGGACVLVSSQVSDAVARNLSVTHTMWSRVPGAGSWVSALLFVAGCAGVARWRPGGAAK